MLLCDSSHCWNGDEKLSALWDILALKGKPEAVLGDGGVAERGYQGVVVALVVHQVPHVEHALHRVRLARARRALHEQEGQRLQADVPTMRCAEVARCCLQVH